MAVVHSAGLYCDLVKTWYTHWGFVRGFERTYILKLLVYTSSFVKGRIPFHGSVGSAFNQPLQPHRIHLSSRPPGKPRSSDHGEFLPAVSIEDEKLR